MGASLALLVPDRTRGLCAAVIQRDKRPDIAFPGCWELPGGGVEAQDYLRPGKFGAEVRCARREMFEELSILVNESDIVWWARYASVRKPDRYNAFVVAQATPDSLAPMSLGSEGRRAALMPVAEFMQHDEAIGSHQEHLADYLRGNSEQALAFGALTHRLVA